MIRRWQMLGVAAGLALALAAAFTASAHQGGGATELSVEPDSLQAGGTVILAGTGLEPDSDRVLVLAGPDITLELGTVKTDSQGMFVKEIAIPRHLPGGSYELRAIGDETLTVALAVTAADGTAASGTGSGEPETVIPHQRHAIELALIGGATLVIFLLGAGLIRFAERFDQPATPAQS